MLTLISFLHDVYNWGASFFLPFPSAFRFIMIGACAIGFYRSFFFRG